MNLDAIQNHPALAGMRNVRQWIVYVLAPSEKRPGKTDKIPLHFATLNPTGVNDPASWTDCETALAVARKCGVGFGVGFAFTEAAGYWFIDLDDALLPDGQWSPLAQQVCTVFAGAAVEVSQSGRGLHVFGCGTIPPHASKNTTHHAEFYHTDRFVALSGDSLVGDCNTDHTAALAWFAATYFPPRETAGAPVADSGPCEGWNGPTDDDELIRRALASRSAAGVFGGKATFADLWDADPAALGRAYPDAERGYDASSADAALAQHLAFWTGKDAARIDRLMRRSALVRDKWDREDYMARTIGKACDQQRDVLADKNLERTGIPAAPPGASTMAAVEGSTFLGAAQAAELFAGCVYIVELHRALLPTGQLLKPEQFRAYFGGYSFAMDARNERTTRNAWEAFTEHQMLRPPRADGVCFRPDLPCGTIIVEPGRTRANTYHPIDVPRAKGDASRFLGHLRKLLPRGDDADQVLYYMAFCVQHQGYKSQWAIVLQGVEGNGKTLLSRCVAEAIGRKYVHWPKASKLAKQFNGWMVGKTFYAVEDIHTTAEGIDVIEELKPMITGGDGLEIEAKGVDQISTEICGNFIFNTNHKNGLKKTRNDRRFALYYCAQQSVDDLARDGMAGDYMHDLYDWLRHGGGFAIVSEMLWTIQIPDRYNPARGCQRAPRTSSTDEAIAQNLGQVEQEVMEAIEQGATGFKGGWVSSIALGHLLERIGKARAVPQNRRRDLMRDLGYDYHPALPDGRTNNVVAIDAGKPRLFLRHGHPALALASSAEVSRAYAAAQSPT
mgnify:CR=1 FL=1